MKRAGEIRKCLVMVSVIGTAQSLASVTMVAVAAFLRAVTSKNLSPTWSGKRLLEGCPDGVVVRLDWHYPDDEANVGVRLSKVGGEIRLEGGGLAYDVDEVERPEAANGEAIGAIAGTVLINVDYGPLHLLRWIGEAYNGPPSVGETEPAKAVPGNPCNGAHRNSAPEFGENIQTAVNPWR